MANQEQLKILKQGVEAWNRWREDNPDERPDLREANLTELNLRGANLSGVELTGASLSGVNLTGALIPMAGLGEANLQKANLTRAFLARTILLGANLMGANLQKANLVETLLAAADFTRANLQGVNLTEANLMGANLQEATLMGANLSRTNLTKTNLRKANLTSVKLAEARLIETNLSEATITGTKLYGTARDDWVIDGITCEYVFWDPEGKIRTPKNRDFRPGEFEELYKHLPTFEYYFEHGFTPIDAVVMDQVVQGINERHPEFSLRLKNFEATGTPHATLTVLHQDHIESAKTQVTTDYERRIAALEGKQEQLMQIVSTLVNQPQYIGELIMGDKRMILAGHNYHERINGNVQITTGTSNSEESSAEQKPGIPGRSSES